MADWRVIMLTLFASILINVVQPVMLTEGINIVTRKFVQTRRTWTFTM